jgi:hypothetical protein
MSPLYSAKHDKVSGRGTDGLDCGSRLATYLIPDVQVLGERVTAGGTRPIIGKLLNVVEVVEIDTVKCVGRHGALPLGQGAPWAQEELEMENV